MSTELTRRNFLSVAAGTAAVTLAACASNEQPAEEPEAEPEGEGEAEPAAAEDAADLVLKNAVVYTVDDNWTVATAVAVKGDEIVYVGDDAGVEAFVGDATDVRDLGGMMVTPGFMNGHDHVEAKPADFCDLSMCEIDLEAYIQAIKEYIEANPGLPYYDVRPADLRAWPNSAPDNQRLNEEFPDTPIVMSDASYHGKIANQAALDLAGVDENTPVPEGGTAYHYEDGTLNGYFSDAGSMLDGLPELPAPTDEQRIEAYKVTEAMFNECGMTGLHDGGSDEAKMKLLYDYGETGDMHLRISLPFWADETQADPGKFVVDVLDANQNLNSDFVRINSTKAIIDGVPEGKSAYMLEPYAETAGVEPDFCSYPYWPDQDVLNNFVKDVNEAGYSVIIHTMGDGGAHMDTIAFQYAYDALGETPATKRNAIVHATIMAPEDIEACGKMGIFNATQCVWFYVDPQFGALELQMFGPERFAREYNMRTRLDAGMFMTSGADYPITPDFRPLAGIQCAMTQGSPYPGDCDDPAQVRNADEAVTFEEALKCYTIWCARQAGFDDICGSIEVGKKADFVVLEKDISKIDPKEISSTRIVYTIFGGKVVFEG